MITLVIQLSSGPWTWQEATEQTVKEFPGEIALFSSDPAEGIRLKLNQEHLTDEQRDWLFAREHVESYHVEGAKPPTDREFKLTARNMELSHENEQFRALLRELATFIKYDPPYGARRLREWQAERDALVERALWAVQPEHTKLSDVPLSEYLTS